jgi:glycosyltransferase involved in cell wall biosynthesis
MNPTVSVVVATYNYARFLIDALESILRQTFSDYEVLVIDDGSSDDTAAVVQPFLADPRVHYYRTRHLGQSGAKNTGIRLARAPLLAFLDADDLWLPDKLARQVALVGAEPELAVVHTRRLLIDEKGRELEYEQPEMPRGLVLPELFRDNFVCFSSVLARREVVEAAGGFDERLPLAIDYDLWLRIARQHCFDHIDEPLVCYRTGHANLSRRIEERLAAVYRIRRRFLDDLGGRALLEPALVRRAEAETCHHLGIVTRGRSRLAALPWHLRAVCRDPTCPLAWRGLFSLWLPEWLRRQLRRALGMPADWSVRRPLSAGC